ncbi:PREDICTED: rab3 GTPase-activating protein catalytic subunit-like [Amphimedon queenslandica]|uniref:Rab3 GTPase-activating protein catalytic subunit n=3 Tax=Amphimedon queenslandica TaxID=400682 RepID=A0AAN0JDW9_AMPQE|nr:PREDICTED: rab3 GTPase-activating protein catalytic subunit-like [Amphimedon queenslandica]|eukprot:XP_019854956.1 PREDICTED: rab3 GTPase-activating protein catalytic subunit-like [Amphimedon queenslandica]
MSDETDDELFEITDFTNASPWESFVSTIEDILQQWGLTASTYSADSGYWPQHRKSEKLSYVGHNFIVSLHVSGEKKRPIPKQSGDWW